MPEEHELAAHLKRIVTGTDLNRADGWCGRFGQDRLGLLRDVRALVQLRLSGCQSHCKGEARGKAAVLAVGLWQKFKNLNPCHCHGFIPPYPVGCAAIFIAAHLEVASYQQVT